MDSQDVVVSDKKILFKHMEIPASYYGRTGYLPLWNISLLYQDTLFLNFWTCVTESDVFPKQDAAEFIIRQKVRIFPYVMRKMSYSKRLHFSTTTECTEVGKSTYIIKSSIEVDEYSDTLCENYSKMVIIDRVTKRPLEFPPWIKEKFKSQMNGQHLEKVSVFRPPSSSFRKDMEVRFSDYDRNGHANASIYYKFMIDCATAASTSGYYRHFSLDMAWYPLREVDVSFLGECKANDTINVFTWQEEKDIEKLYFAMFVMKNCVFQGTAIFEMTAFQDLSDSKL